MSFLPCASSIICASHFFATATALIHPFLSSPHVKSRHVVSFDTHDKNPFLLDRTLRADLLARCGLLGHRHIDIGNRQNTWSAVTETRKNGKMERWKDGWEAPSTDHCMESNLGKSLETDSAKAGNHGVERTFPSSLSNGRVTDDGRWVAPAFLSNSAAVLNSRIFSLSPYRGHSHEEGVGLSTVFNIFEAGEGIDCKRA